MATPGVAQEAASALPWSATLSYDAQQIAPAPDEAYWHTVTAGVGRRFSGGSLLVQGLATRRFDIDDQAVIAEVYHDLWRGAYGRVRGAVAPGAEVLSRTDVGGEIFQTVGRNELSLSARRQRFDVAEVTTIGGGAGHYVGSWFLRARVLTANVEESWSPFFAATARRYLGGSTDNLFDLTAGLGQEVLEVAGGGASGGSLDVITSGARFASARVQRYFTPRIGGSVGGTYSAYDEIPNRWGMSLSLITRW